MEANESEYKTQDGSKMDQIHTAAAAIAMAKIKVTDCRIKLLCNPQETRCGMALRISAYSKTTTASLLKENERSNPWIICAQYTKRLPLPFAMGFFSCLLVLLNHKHGMDLELVYNLQSVTVATTQNKSPESDFHQIKMLRHLYLHI